MRREDVIFVLVMYGLPTLAVFLINAGAAYELRDGIQDWTVAERNHSARLALAAPLWPLTLLVISVRGFVRLVRWAVSRG